MLFTFCICQVKHSSFGVYHRIHKNATLFWSTGDVPLSPFSSIQSIGDNLSPCPPIRGRENRPFVLLIKNNWKPEQIHIVSILVSNYGRGTIDNRQRAYGSPSVVNGLSHALENMSPACFLPSLRSGRAFKSWCHNQKSPTPNGVGLFWQGH